MDTVYFCENIFPFLFELWFPIFMVEEHISVSLSISNLRMEACIDILKFDLFVLSNLLKRDKKIPLKLNLLGYELRHL